MTAGLQLAPGSVTAWVRRVVVAGYGGYTTARRFRGSGAADGFTEQLRGVAHACADADRAELARTGTG